MRRDGPDEGDALVTGLVTVALTEQHITDGERAVDHRLSRERNCPVAHALAAAGFENPRVRMQVFTAGADNSLIKGERRRYRLPPAAVTLIERFDDNLVVDPTTFTVNADDYERVLCD